MPLAEPHIPEHSEINRMSDWIMFGRFRQMSHTTHLHKIQRRFGSLIEQLQ